MASRAASGVAITNRAIDRTMHLRRLFQISCAFHGLTTHFEEDGRDHVHQCGEDSDFRCGRDGLMEAHVVHKKLLRFIK